MPGPFGVKNSDDKWMMPAWQKFPLLETLAAGTGLNVGLQNDAAACATAERIVGAAHGIDHAVCLYVGYGIGAGLILNGELYNGGNGNAGEIGMALLSPAGPGSTPLEHRASLASLYQHLDMNLADEGLYEQMNALATAEDPKIMAWIGGAARSALERASYRNDLRSADRHPDQRCTWRRWPAGSSRQCTRCCRRSRTGLDGCCAPAASASPIPGRSRSVAAAEPISRAFDPRFSAILKTRSGGSENDRSVALRWRKTRCEGRVDNGELDGLGGHVF